ncbi:MAG: CAP domain-containing protein [Paenibacillaceae bacterium]|nr:CAP domain-containing protein [Paenibacillaceae bacterium]
MNGNGKNNGNCNNGNGSNTNNGNTNNGNTNNGNTNNGNTNNGNTNNGNTNNGNTNNGNTNNGSTTNKTYTQQVVDLVNAERAKAGLAPLTIDANVEKAANVRANEIQTSFDHVRPNGSSFSTALREQSVNFQGAGENIAWGQKTPEEVMNAWMNSAGHRANILNKNFTHIGVGNLQNSAGTQYWVQLFTY